MSLAKPSIIIVSLHWDKRKRFQNHPAYSKQNPWHRTKSISVNLSTSLSHKKERHLATLAPYNHQSKAIMHPNKTHKERCRITNCVIFLAHLDDQTSTLKEDLKYKLLRQRGLAQWNRTLICIPIISCSNPHITPW